MQKKKKKVFKNIPYLVLKTLIENIYQVIAIFPLPRGYETT